MNLHIAPKVAPKHLGIAGALLTASFLFSGCDPEPPVDNSNPHAGLLKLEKLTRDPTKLDQIARETKLARDWLYGCRRMATLCELLFEKDSSHGGIASTGAATRHSTEMESLIALLRRTSKEMLPDDVKKIEALLNFCSNMAISLSGRPTANYKGNSLEERMKAANPHTTFEMCFNDWVEKIDGGKNTVGGLLAQRFATEFAASLDRLENSLNNIAYIKLSPAYLNVGDGTLLRITQEGDKLKFHRNATGYAEVEGGATLYGVGGSVTAPISNLYFELNPLEAFALMGYDCAPIRRASASQETRNAYAVDPNLIELTFLRMMPPPDAGVRSGVSGMSPGEPLPVYIKLPDSNLLRITQKNGTISFHKTSEGYAAAGVKVNVAGFGIDGTMPLANIYHEINAEEALAYLNGEPELILSVVRRMNQTFDSVVSPKSVARALGVSVKE